MPEAHLDAPGAERMAGLPRSADRMLFPAINAKVAMAAFDAAESQALAVVDGRGARRVVGLLTEAHLLLRYGEELDRRRNEEAGLA